MAHRLAQEQLEELARKRLWVRFAQRTSDAAGRGRHGDAETLRFDDLAPEVLAAAEDLGGTRHATD